MCVFTSVEFCLNSTLVGQTNAHLSPRGLYWRKLVTAQTFTSQAEQTVTHLPPHNTSPFHYPLIPWRILYSYRDLQQSYRSIQESYRTRKFELECSISAPVRSSVHWNGTYPTLKTFLRFFNYRSFKGVEAPEGCKNVAQIFTTLQLSHRDWKFVLLAPKLAGGYTTFLLRNVKWRNLGAGEPAAMQTVWAARSYTCNFYQNTTIPYVDDIE